MTKRKRINWDRPTERSKFEEWARKNPAWRMHLVAPLINELHNAHDFGDHINVAWSAWQARARLARREGK